MALVRSGGVLEDRSQMQRSRYPIVAALLLALVAAPAVAAQPGSRDARAGHERIVRFWTPARMKAAIPRDFVLTARGLEPAARPDNAGKGKPGGGGGGGGTVTGAAWNKGGQVKESVGKVFFRMGGTLYTCSGSVTADGRSTHSLVLTAAHCAWDERDGSFATDWMFIPDYESAPTRTCADTKYGCWTAQALVVHQGYADQDTFNEAATRHDFAFAVVGSGGKSGVAPQLDVAVDAFPITFSSFLAGTRMYAFGYPAAGKYKGNKLIYCAGPISFDAWNDDATYGLECDMTGGSSGGPWFSDFEESTGIGTQSSLNSYGYAGVKSMFGPKFNSATKAVFDAADAATGNQIVGSG